MLKLVLSMVMLISLSSISFANETKDKNNSEQNSTISNKSVSHVGGFAVSGRVSTIKEKPNPKDKKPKEINSTKK